MTEQININIWDDYYEDGYVPSGEIQETYAYIESNLSHDESKEVLEILKKEMIKFLESEFNVELDIKFYDSAKIYPNLVGTEMEYCLFKRWQLEIKNLTHTAREQFVGSFEAKKFSYLDKPICVYSES